MLEKESQHVKAKRGISIKYIYFFKSLLPVHGIGIVAFLNGIVELFVLYATPPVLQLLLPFWSYCPYASPTLWLALPPQLPSHFSYPPVGPASPVASSLLLPSHLACPPTPPSLPLPLPSHSFCPFHALPDCEICKKSYFTSWREWKGKGSWRPGGVVG